MRLLLFSDLHLDAAFAWAPRAVARRRRQALRDTLVRIVALADEVDADAIVCGGDLYEHERFTPDTAAFLQATFGATDRRVVIAPGNHDWFGPGSLYVHVDWPANVTVFSEDRLAPLDLADGLTLWGAAHRKPAGTDGFLDRGFEVGRGGVNLALFHGSERSGLPFEDDGKQPHAPFDAAQLEAAGIDHAFLGHFHRPKAAERHTYPGNPDPLTFGEDGVRGAVVVDVHDDGTVDRDWHVVARSYVADIELDVTGCASSHDAIERARAELAGRQGAVRLTVSGELAPEAELDLDDLAHVAPHLEAVVVRRGRLHVAYDLAAIAAEPTVRGQFVADVLADESLTQDERERTIVVGLRALDGRDDLEVA